MSSRQSCDMVSSETSFATSNSSSSSGNKLDSKKGRGRSHRHDGAGWSGIGGYIAAKKQKLDTQFNSQKGLKSQIFHGVAIYINGYTEPSSDCLQHLIRQHGGRYEQYLLKTRVTHIIATSLPDSKIHSLRDFKVVKPQWITDSIKAGHLLSHAPYKLFTRQGNSLASFSTILTHSTSVFSEDNSGSRGTLHISGSKDSMNTCGYKDSLGSSVRQQGIRTEYGEVNECKSTQNSNTNVEVDNFDGTGNDLIIADMGRMIGEKSLESPAENLPSSENAKISSSSAVAHYSEKAKISSSSAVAHYSRNSSVNGNNSSTSPSSKSKAVARAGDPKFLSEFYSHSRLHHLSTWGAELRAYVSKLQKESDGSFPGRDRLRQFHVQKMVRMGLEQTLESSRHNKTSRIIMHIDMDCFFVSVGLRHQPELKGKPVAVTHSRGKGLSEPVPGSDLAFEKAQWRRHREEGRQAEKDTELQPNSSVNFITNTGDPQDLRGKEMFQSLAEIACCSYEARKAGVKNGMFMGKAKELCPDLVTIPYDFEGYSSVSRIMYDTVASYTHDIEAVSCDEMLIDCTDLLSDTGASALQFAELLRQDIVQKTGCTASAGIASNILLARLATRRAKPNGQFHLQKEDVLDFIKEQSVRDLPGVGWSMTRKLSKNNVQTCGDLQKLALSTLRKELGPKTGQTLYQFCRGEDNRPIKTEKERKSVSADVNYGIRFQNEVEAVKFVEELAAEVSNRLQAIGMKCRTLTLKLMVRRSDAPAETAKFLGHGICNNLSKSATLPIATDDAGMLGKEAVMLLKAMKIDASDLRGIGLQTHRLESSTLGLGLAPSAAVSSNQSILSFAVARGSAEDKPQMHIPRAVNTKPAGPVIADTNLRNDRDSGCTTRLRQHSDREKEPPLPCLLGVNLNTKAIDTKEFFLSPSQVDKEVLKELPEHIQQQIEREIREANRVGRNVSSPKSGRTHRVRVKPGCSHWATPPDESSSDSSQGGSLGKPAGSNHLQLSFSQIDPDVLQELPLDIQQQLQQEMAVSRTRASVTRISCSPPHNQRSPSPEIISSVGSQKSSSEVAETQLPEHRSLVANEVTESVVLGGALKHNGDDDRSGIPSLPNLSQLDPSCMEALPPDLQDEIWAAYSRQQPQQQHRSLYGQLTSPTKHPIAGSGRGRGRGRGKVQGQNRGRGRGKRSPVFKVPQGQPVMRRKKDFQPQQLDFDVQTSKQNSPQKGSTAETSTTATAKVAHRAGDSRQEDVSLCGAVTLSEVRNLLSEWLDSTTDPQDQDIDVMVSYLGKLVLDKDLEQVDLVLKFLYRKIVKQQRLSWVKPLDSIITHTQDLIWSVHGSRLKTDWMR